MAETYGRDPDILIGNCENMLSGVTAAGNAQIRMLAFDQPWRRRTVPSTRSTAP
jgi:hypothetical protein